MTYNRYALPPELERALAAVRSVGIITGAGISAESGIPTYRGKGGIYDDEEEGDRTVEALTGSTLATDPDRTWRTIAGLARLARAAQPNPAHHAVVEIEQSAERFVLLTQNVDRLHQTAGSRNVIDIHGDIFATRCTACDHHGQLDRIDDIDRTPRCHHCGGGLRPAVVLFGEMLAPAKVHLMTVEFFTRRPDLVLIAGTSALFPYIVEPVAFARADGRLTIEINPEATAVSELCDFSLRDPASVALPLIAAALATRAG